MSERSTVEILRAARERISDPERWTQRAECRAKQRGPETHPVEGTCWCALGSLAAERTSTLQHFECVRLLESAARERYPWSVEPVVAVNDRAPRRIAHPAVLALYDRAIQLAEEASC